jgi:hypothetical protein
VARVRFPVGTSGSSPLHSIQAVSGPIQSLMQRTVGVIVAKGQQTERGADHSPLYIAEIKNDGGILPPLPQAMSCGLLDVYRPFGVTNSIFSTEGRLSSRWTLHDLPKRLCIGRG